MFLHYKRVLYLLKPAKLIVCKVVGERVTVIKFRISAGLTLRGALMPTRNGGLLTPSLPLPFFFPFPSLPSP